MPSLQYDLFSRFRGEARARSMFKNNNIIALFLLMPKLCAFEVVLCTTVNSEQKLANNQSETAIVETSKHQ
jgi:hypothetical protein